MMKDSRWVVCVTLVLALGPSFVRSRTRPHRQPATATASLTLNHPRQPHSILVSGTTPTGRPST